MKTFTSILCLFIAITQAVKSPEPPSNCVTESRKLQESETQPEQIDTRVSLVDQIKLTANLIKTGSAFFRKVKTGDIIKVTIQERDDCNWIIEKNEAKFKLHSHSVINGNESLFAFEMIQAGRTIIHIVCLTPEEQNLMVRGEKSGPLIKLVEKRSRDKGKQVVALVA